MIHELGRSPSFYYYYYLTAVTVCEAKGGEVVLAATSVSKQDGQDPRCYLMHDDGHKIYKM
jgi:hypothetical protein